MKLLYIILLILTILPNARALESISIDDFRKVTDSAVRAKLINQVPPEERDELKKVDLHLSARALESISIDDFRKVTDSAVRAKLINQAPPEERDELKKVDLHLRLVAGLGGEAAVKFVKEKAVERTRGLAMLENVFTTQAQVWDGYIGDFLNGRNNVGMTHERFLTELKKLEVKRNVIGDRLFNVVHPLVSNLAVSPQALVLEKKAEAMDRYMWDNFPPSDATKHITKEQLIAVDKQMDRIFDEMKHLPKLTAKEAQKEYNDFPEEDIRPTDQ